MEALAPHWNKFTSIVEPHGETIITWMTEGSSVTNAPVKGWPMVSFSAAVAVVIAYVFGDYLSVGGSWTNPGRGAKVAPAATKQERAAIEDHGGRAGR